jgi:uncharacterized protein YbjT (DUF2867 family)
MAAIFITGATGYMGRRLTCEFLARGHRVLGLARAGSEARLTTGCEAVIGDALDPATFRDRVQGCDTLVHLVGVAHPSPSKAAQFRAIDLASARAAISAALMAGVQHFIYVSVAHPAPVMREYIGARMEAEAALRKSGLNATILRPWYVLGPGHRWPYFLVPLYWVLRAIPATREGARRLGLVTLPQMVGALADAVENPARGVKVLEVPQISR